MAVSTANKEDASALRFKHKPLSPKARAIVGKPPALEQPKAGGEDRPEPARLLRRRARSAGGE